MVSLILLVIFRTVGRWAIADPAAELAAHAAGAALTVLAADMAHRWVELPGMAAGERFLGWLRAPGRRAQAVSMLRATR